MNNYNILDEIKYTKIGETEDAKQKQLYWNVAFGLQEVDSLKPSKYMVSLAKDNIQGKKTYDAVESEIKGYYSSQHSKNINTDEKEADEVSLRIVRILDDKSFTFNHLTYKHYHKLLFEGIDIGIKHNLVGGFRTYNITKSEPILNGDTVSYADYRMIEETLKYDFAEEASQKYSTMSDEQKVKRIALFTSRIWQVHPFGEGNTRTTAVFIQKYLNSKGFNVNNDLFKDNSLYFRNALVRANYSKIQQKIEEDDSFLVVFFENLLLNKDNLLDNDKLFLTAQKKEIFTMTKETASMQYIDESIIINRDSLPPRINNIIDELEEFAKEDDFVSYDCKYEELDTVSKNYILSGKMSTAAYRSLERKYGGIE